MLPLYDANPTRSTPVMVYTLVLCNVAVFLYQVLILGNHVLMNVFFETWAVIPKQLFSNPNQEYFTLISYQFLHGGWEHILSNMWYLWIFGNNVEDYLGKFRFMFFYLACGVIAAVVQSIFSANVNAPLVGASGSVSGVMGAYIRKYPRAIVFTLIPPIFIVPLPAVVLLGFWIVGQTIYAFTALHSNVAFIAHVAGFAAGMILVRTFSEEEE